MYKTLKYISNVFKIYTLIENVQNVSLTANKICNYIYDFTYRSYKRFRVIICVIRSVSNI